MYSWQQARPIDALSGSVQCETVVDVVSKRVVDVTFRAPANSDVTRSRLQVRRSLYHSWREFATRKLRCIMRDDVTRSRRTSDIM